MRGRTGLLFAIAAVLTLALASHAFATAQPTSPTPSANTNSHPTFTWTLPANEDADWVSVASRPETTPTGEFFEESIVDMGYLTGGSQTQWAPSSALFAGAHWWTVRTHDRTTGTPTTTSPSPFTVATEMRMIRFRIRRDSYLRIPDQLSISVTWATNVRNVVAEVRVQRGRRRVGLLRRPVQTFAALDPDTEYFTWRRPRGVRTGTRLTVLLAVRGGGRAATVRRIVRAP